MLNQTNLQAMIDGWSAQWQKERAATQMTLGAFIERLEQLPGDLLMDGLGEPHSYRGYYCDLAFERVADKRPVAEVLADARQAMGQVFEGYKGGDYMMGASTPLWVANYGESGAPRIMGVRDDGVLVLEDEP